MRYALTPARASKRRCASFTSAMWLSDQSESAPSGFCSVRPSGVTAYSTRGGMTGNTVRVTSPSRSRSRNVCVSIGHSDAELPAAHDAVQAGARHATHTFNAMRPLDHREPGILGEVLSNDRLSADIIVDGIHVAPSVVKLFLRAKGRNRAVLITDAISATGMPDGRYQLGPIEVDVKDGKCTSNGSLAGSVLTMDRAVRNVTQFSNWTLRDAVQAATLNPARAVGLSAHHGTLAKGAAADFTVLSATEEVLKTIVRGREA